LHTVQLGHQAVNCTNGTINWKQIYGDEAFRLKKPIYESDYQALKKSKQVDLVDLEKRARQYAKVGALCSHVTSAACLQECWEAVRSAHPVDRHISQLLKDTSSRLSMPAACPDAGGVHGH
jgi:hypothetical protein